MSIPYLYYFISRIRKLRRRSEELADLASWLCITSELGSSVPLEECFQIPVTNLNANRTEADKLTSLGFFGDTKPRRFVPNIHPTREERLRNVSSYSEVLQGRRKAVRISSTFSFVSLGLLGAVGAAIAGVVLFPVFSQAKKSAQATATLSNAKLLGLGLLIYASDFDDYFPCATTETGVQGVLYSYTKNSALWHSEDQGGGELLFNGQMVARSMTSLAEPNQSVAIFEENMPEIGTRAITFADGHARRLTQDAWSRYEIPGSWPEFKPEEQWQVSVSKLPN